jgi:type II secretory pathway pseudopilin PulG
MVAMMVMLTIMAIMIAAVAPTVSKIMQREREAELIFRGQQYAQGIQLFQRKFGRFPNTLKEMVENQPRTMRKLFKDPMCNCDDWGLIRQGQPWPPQGFTNGTGTDTSTANPIGPETSTQPPPGPQRSGSSGTGFQTPSFNFNPIGPATSTQPPAGRFGTGSSSSGPRSGAAGFSNDAMFRNSGQEVSNMPIIGVHSKVHKEGLRSFKGSSYYDEWGFIAGQSNDDLPLPALPPGAPPSLVPGYRQNQPSQ